MSVYQLKNLLLTAEKRIRELEAELARNYAIMHAGDDRLLARAEKAEARMFSDASSQGPGRRIEWVGSFLPLFPDGPTLPGFTPPHAEEILRLKARVAELTDALRRVWEEGSAVPISAEAARKVFDEIEAREREADR